MLVAEGRPTIGVDGRRRCQSAIPPGGSVKSTPSPRCPPQTVRQNLAPVGLSSPASFEKDFTVSSRAKDPGFLSPQFVHTSAPS